MIKSVQLIFPSCDAELEFWYSTNAVDFNEALNISITLLDVEETSLWLSKTDLQDLIQHLQSAYNRINTDNGIKDKAHIIYNVNKSNEQL